MKPCGHMAHKPDKYAHDCFITIKNQIQMKKIRFNLWAIINLGFIIGLLTACTGERHHIQGMQDEIDSLTKLVDRYHQDSVTTEKYLMMIDTLDFKYYNQQKWDSLALVHDANINIHYSDGNITQGLFPNEANTLKAMFVFAPDTKVIAHPVRFGKGDWTCVTSTVEGTFTRPMLMANNKTIPPNGRKFKINIATIGHWGKNGKMMEEYLFCDNQDFSRQLRIEK